ncbi:hypothetical protein HGRIS_006881 [Hohenbuehelia grisea]|uniref:Methyltransferase domain-containing protein n=1 Tax=Hohenbuehelia grisea TaxID=104357 RepID=A0ABR3JAW4_9AGAR
MTSNNINLTGPHAQASSGEPPQDSLGNAEDDEDDPAAYSDLDDNMSALTELNEDEFPSYFAERDGRLFHSHGSSPYPLPVDGHEQQRLDAQHVALQRMLGGNYFGPVPAVLAPDANRQRLVLDLGSGTGKWVLEMANEFPHVSFHGLDIVPIATRYPPNNVFFEVQDMNEPWRWGDATVDIVHARSISMAVRSTPNGPRTVPHTTKQVHDFAEIARKVARVLRPGGLFLSCEWVRGVLVHPNLPYDVATYIPAISRFFDMVKDTLDRLRGIECLAGQVPQYLHDTGAFGEIMTREECIPLGPWASDDAPHVVQTGRIMRASFVRYAEALRPLLMEAGCTPDFLNSLFAEMKHELRVKEGLVCNIHAVFARKV